ncbi:hypothetical protein [Bhargavaea cecembensis]|uniref:hypothetical protein n=1 Tax=Bhargavaea cecembensis TaxID=394098 RepID=UPI000693D6C4|nr:hypothetical protein [Bhargavaea cecembensis]
MEPEEREAMGNRRNKWIGRPAAAGLAAGVFLGALLYAAEKATGLKVYTLLMNIDYVPVLKEYRFPAPVEFSFHLIVSVVLAVILFRIVLRFRWTGRRMAGWVTALNGIVGLGIWPVTALSERTPALGDAAALGVWLAAHLLYGGVLAWMFGRILRKEES